MLIRNIVLPAATLALAVGVALAACGGEEVASQAPAPKLAQAQAPAAPAPAPAAPATPAELDNGLMLALAQFVKAMRRSPAKRSWRASTFWWKSRFASPAMKRRNWASWRKEPIAF